MVGVPGPKLSTQSAAGGTVATGASPAAAGEDEEDVNIIGKKSNSVSAVLPPSPSLLSPSPSVISAMMRSMEEKNSTSSEMDSLKKRIFEVTGIPIEDQRIWHKQVLLTDPEATLTRCGIANGAEMMIRCKPSLKTAKRFSSISLAQQARTSSSSKQQRHGITPELEKNITENDTLHSSIANGPEFFHSSSKLALREKRISNISAPGSMPPPSSSTTTSTTAGDALNAALMNAAKKSAVAGGEMNMFLTPPPPAILNKKTQNNNSMLAHRGTSIIAGSSNSNSAESSSGDAGGGGSGGRSSTYRREYTVDCNLLHKRMQNDAGIVKDLEKVWAEREDGTFGMLDGRSSRTSGASASAATRMSTWNFYMKIVGSFFSKSTKSLLSLKILKNDREFFTLIFKI